MATLQLTWPRVAPLYYLSNALAYWLEFGCDPEGIYTNPRRLIHTLTLTNAHCHSLFVSRICIQYTI